MITRNSKEPEIMSKKSRNFSLHDAIAIKCSEKGFSLLQWDFNTKSKFPRYSQQMPTEVCKQILTWRDNQKLNFELGDYL